jgi:hypothetical protein
MAALNKGAFMTDDLSTAHSTFGVGKAILIGHLIVNVPVVAIILVFFSLGVVVAGLVEPIFPLQLSWLFWPIVLGLTLIGFILAWLWWSYSVPRWRKWAIQSGAPADKLHRWAVVTGLEWSKRNPLSDTEFQVKD